MDRALTQILTVRGNEPVGKVNLWLPRTFRREVAVQ